jgi:hypothetical protein
LPSDNAAGVVVIATVLAGELVVGDVTTTSAY